jgi:hypothetical protein
MIDENSAPEEIVKEVIDIGEALAMATNTITRKGPKAPFTVPNSFLLMDQCIDALLEVRDMLHKRNQLRAVPTEDASDSERS